MDEWALLDNKQPSNAPSRVQVEEYSHVTGIPAHECGHELEGERLSQRVSIKEEAKLKTPQKDKSVMFMECEVDKIASTDEATRGASVADH